MGREPEDLAPSLAHLDCIRHASGVHLGLLLILEGWTPSRREDVCLLLRLRRWFLHLQYRDVGHRRWYSARLEEQLQQQGHVGMVLRRQSAQESLREGSAV